jgi:hypothetical protein
MTATLADHLPPRLREALLAELDTEESLRWCGQPLPSRLFRKAVPPALGVSAMLAVFGAMCLSSTLVTWRDLADPAVSGAVPIREASSVAAMAALGAALSLAALGALSSPWFAKARARRTVYALTNTRVFALVRSRSGRLQSEVVEPGHPLSIARREHADGSGDVVLYPFLRAPRGQLVLAAAPEPRTLERLIRTTFDPLGGR